MQVDGLNELPKEKIPVDELIWNGTGDELNEWLDEVIYKNTPTTLELEFSDDEIEN